MNIRSLPGQPRSARIDGAIPDSFETKRSLIMGCAILACVVLMVGAAATGLVLGWKVEAVELFAALVFTLGGFLSMFAALLVLRFVLG